MKHESGARKRSEKAIREKEVEDGSRILLQIRVKKETEEEEEEENEEGRQNDHTCDTQKSHQRHPNLEGLDAGNSNTYIMGK